MNEREGGAELSDIEYSGAEYYDYSQFGIVVKGPTLQLGYEEVHNDCHQRSPTQSTVSYDSSEDDYGVIDMPTEVELDIKTNYEDFCPSQLN